MCVCVSQCLCVCLCLSVCVSVSVCVCLCTLFCIAVQTHRIRRLDQVAEAKWETDKLNLDVQRRGQGSGLRLAVMGIPTTSGNVTVLSKRQLHASSQLGCAAEVEQAMKRMRFGAFGSDLSSEAFSQVGGAVFGHGAASSGTAASSSSAQMMLLDNIDAAPFQFSSLERAASLQPVIALDGGSEDEGAVPALTVQMSPRCCKCCFELGDRIITRMLRLFPNLRSAYEVSQLHM
jgi:hypothetical protein